MPRVQATTSAAQAQQDTIMDAEGIDSYELPKAVLTRIVKSDVSTRSLFGVVVVIYYGRLGSCQLMRSFNKLQ